MGNDVSGFGLRLTIVASKTFPQGIVVTQFADDSDPLDFPSMNIGETGMGLNGDLVSWSKANPVKASVGVIPGSDDDKNLSILANANRVGRGKTSVQDVITMTGVYPDGTTKTVTGGKITDFMPGASVSSAGRQKSKVYQFHFEGLAET